jgi:transcriptional regulator with XRE-family HTH domain
MPAAARSQSSQERAVLSVLERERHKRGMTQRELADAAGISQTQVSRILAGQRAATVSEFLFMCEGLGVSPRAVVEEAEGVRLSPEAVAAQLDSDAQAGVREGQTLVKRRSRKRQG